MKLKFHHYSECRDIANPFAFTSARFNIMYQITLILILRRGVSLCKNATLTYKTFPDIITKAIGAPISMSGRRL